MDLIRYTLKEDYPPVFKKGDEIDVDIEQVVKAGDWAVDPNDHGKVKHITEKTTFKKRYWKIAGRMRHTI